LFEVADARGRPRDRSGARLGNVAGSFLHLIDRSSEPDAGASGPRHLRLIEG
jgi:hypothetical protein